MAGSDRTGRTIFDIQEKVSRSCLDACRTVLARVGKAAGVSPCTTPSLLSTTSDDQPLAGFNERVTLHKHLDLSDRQAEL